LTFSIVARDPKTGHYGVAVQSHFFSVGSRVPWARAGVGAVATQALVEISYGPLGLDLLSSGKGARETLDALKTIDPKVERRQVAMIDSHGEVAVHTGRECTPEAGYTVGDQFVCQANLMRTTNVWKEMASTFESESSLDLPERLIATLEAGQRAGGDLRGMQSAAILVVDSKVSATGWQGVLVNLRVEDDRQPIAQLKRLLGLQRAYDLVDKAALLLSEGKTEESSKAYSIAAKLAPEVEELQFWQSVSLVQASRLEEARKIFSKVSEKNPDWIQVALNLQKVGRLPRGSLGSTDELSD
jgi:uncharacterized Ntn-hydrolase superfamily protein